MSRKQYLDDIEVTNGVIKRFEISGTTRRSPYRVTREGARYWLGLVLFLTFLACVIASFAWLFIKQSSFGEFKEILALLVSATVGLLGSVTGFYYGSRTAETDD